MPLNGQDRIRPAEFHYPAGHTADEHAHNEHQLVYASIGLLTVDTSYRRWVVPPLRAVWVPAGITHQVTAKTDATMSTLYIHGSTRIPGLSDVTVVKMTPLLRELILHITASSPTQQQHQRVEAVILDQLTPDPAAPLQIPVLSDSRIRSISDALQQDPTDSRTLAQFGHDVGASERTLQRLFQAETGTTFGHWRTQLRLQHSIIELGRGASVTTAAINSGYLETSAYISAFKRAFGTTPGAYFRTNPRP